MNNETYKKPQWHRWIVQNINTDRYCVIVRVCLECGEIRTETIDMREEKENGN